MAEEEMTLQAQYLKVAEDAFQEAVKIPTVSARKERKQFRSICLLFRSLFNVSTIVD